MNVKDYVDLKSKSAVAFSKANDSDGVTRYYLTEKRFDPNTGSAVADAKREVNLEEYESELVRVNTEIANLEENKVGYTKIIEDIKAL